MDYPFIKAIIFIILWLILTLNTGCTALPQKNDPIESISPAGSQTLVAPPAAPAPEINFFAGTTPLDPFEAEFARIAAQPDSPAEPEASNPDDYLPMECRGLSEHARVRCWHSYLTSVNARKFNEACEYSFQCPSAADYTCQFGADSARPATSICTVKLPGGE